MYNYLRHIILVFITFFGFQLSVSAQSMDQFAGYIKTGSASDLARYFQSNVEINTSNGGNSYSKSQAEQVLNNFFKTHSVKSFTVAHQGTSPEGAKFVIGNLVTVSGNYRVFLYAKATAGALAIQEIRFEEQ